MALILDTGPLYASLDRNDALDQLAQDYQQMLKGWLLLDDAVPFERLMERCRLIEEQANAASG